MAAEYLITNLPLEIRLKIYSYLLLDYNVVTLSPDRHLYSSFTTSIFTVNRQLSVEARHYFYTQNAFVVIEVNVFKFLQNFRRSIPIFVGQHVQGFNSYAMKITYQTDRIESRIVDTRTEPPIEYGVVAGRHLSNLIRLFNAEHSRIWRDKVTVKIDLNFCLQRRYFEGNEMTTRMLVHGIKGLRRMYPYGDATDVTTILRPPRAVPGAPVVLTVHGDVKPEQIQEIIAATNLPDLDSQGIIAEGAECLERGKTFMLAKDYNAARGELFIAIQLTGHRAYEISLQRNGGLLPELRLLMLQIFMQRSLLESLQKQHKDAIDCANFAWVASARISRGGGPLISEVVKASIEQRIGEALVDGGAYEDAVNRFQSALRMDPSNELLKMKLDVAKAKVAEMKVDGANLVNDTGILLGP